ncbi:MAG: hypothetical protein WCO71_04970, partial [Pseudomonadota bacterium]
MTRGFSNDLAAAMIRLFNPPYPLPAVTQGILGELTPEKASEIVSRIENDGYYVFDTKLSPEKIESLLKFGLETPCAQRAMDNQDQATVRTEPLTYPRATPQAARYDIRMNSLVNFKDSQEIIADETLLMIAQKYLKSRPVLDIV